MRYQLTNNAGYILNVDTGQIISNADYTNIYWREYQAWIASGNTPQAAPAPPTPPDPAALDYHDKALVALALVLANYTGHTPAQVRAAFITAWNALP